MAHLIPARPKYAAQATPALPEESTAHSLIPQWASRVAIIEALRSLNEPVALTKSSFAYALMPSTFIIMSGETMSPRETGASVGRNGRFAR
jgi:hypothetical protein